jgi:hypothetical protein
MALPVRQDGLLRLRAAHLFRGLAALLLIAHVTISLLSLTENNNYYRPDGKKIYRRQSRQ